MNCGKKPLRYSGTIARVAHLCAILAYRASAGRLSCQQGQGERHSTANKGHELPMQGSHDPTRRAYVSDGCLVFSSSSSEAQFV